MNSITNSDSSNAVTDRKQHKPYEIIALAVIILLQIIVIVYHIAVVKEDYHSDELWFCGLANSSYLPYIYDEELYVDDSLRDMNNIWLDGEEYHSYLTVDKEHRFDYGSVLYNLECDMHPPLYFVILHTVCSFFPGVFSVYLLLSVNIAALIIGQIFFYRMWKKLTGSVYISLAFTVAWGFTSGFISLNALLKSYALLAMFAIILLYYHVVLYKEDGISGKTLAGLGISLLLGCLTHYYFYIQAVVIAACFCFYFLFRKKFKKLFAYAGVMMGSAVLALVMFPKITASIFRSLNDSGPRLENNMPFANGFRVCLSMILSPVTGIRIGVFSTGGYMYFVIAAVALAALLIPLGFLFRNEEWMKKLTGSAKEVLKRFIHSIDFLLVFLVLDCIVFCCVIAKTVNINAMSAMTDRYLFQILPWSFTIIFLLIYYIVKNIRGVEKALKPVLSVLCCAAVIASNINHPKNYMFLKYIEGEPDIHAALEEGSNAIVLLDQYWMTTAFSEPVMKCDKVFCSRVYAYRYYIDTLKELDINDKTYITVCVDVLANNVLTSDENIKKANENNGDTKVITEADSMTESTEEYDEYTPRYFTEQDLIEDFETKIYPGYKLQYCSSEYVFNRRFHTFRIVPEDEYVEKEILL